MQQLLKRLQRHHASFIPSCSSSGGSSSRGYHMEQQQQQQMRPTKKVSLEITRSRDDASADWRAKPLVGRYHMFRRCCCCPSCCPCCCPLLLSSCCCPCCCPLLLSPADAPCCCPCCCCPCCYPPWVPHPCCHPRLVLHPPRQLFESRMTSTILQYHVIVVTWSYFCLFSIPFDFRITSCV